MQYNRSLDLLAVAMSHYAAGDVNKASAAFVAAATCQSADRALAIIEASNSKAVEAKAKKASKQVKAKSQVVTAAWPFSAVASTNITSYSKRIRASEAVQEDSPGEELREAPDENGDRIVQEANSEDMAFLDVDGGELEMYAEAEDEEEDDSEDEDDEGGDDEEEGEKSEESASARFAKFTRNATAARRRAAASKKKARSKKR